MRTGIRDFLQFLKSIFVCDSCSEMNDNEHEMEESPLKKTVASLSRTPKGRIVYDRVPLLPINESTSSSKSGVLLSEDIFNRNPVDLTEKSVDSQQFPHQQILHPASMSFNNKPSLFMDFPVQHTEKRINHFKWQQELLLMRNTNQLDETTPVYNLSTHMIMQLFELKEAQRLSMASSFMKKMEDFKESSRRTDDEECLRKKQELEERLVPKTESEIDVEMTMQRLQNEAKLRIQLKEDQINKKLKEVQSIQEKELQEDLKKKTLELQISECKRRKEIIFEKLELLLKSLDESKISCLNKDSFLPTIQMKLDRVTALKTQFQVVANTVNADPFVSVTRSENIVKQIEDLSEAIKEDISKNNAAVHEKVVSANHQVTLPPTVKLPVNQEQRNHDHSDQTTSDTDEGCREDYLLYSQLKSELSSYESSAAAFVNNISLKSFRCDLQKAVHQPLNQISDLSGQHLQDKLDRLASLLRGNAVNLGSKMVRAVEHAGGLEYCTHLLAKSMVKQGEDQVNVNPKAAFPIAAVITELWIEFPIFGRLVLAHFYKQCPYLVPYYSPQKEGESNEEYYISLGYKYFGGKVEQQPAYLKRMSGIIRLYAAILVSLPRRNQPHPHGLEHAWRYLAALLNLSPRNDITAIILAEFLSVTSHAMSKEYGKQFQKILILICTDYFIMIENVTPKDSGGGPVNRLKDFLHMSIQSIKEGRIPPPPVGQLPPRFW